MEKSGTAPVLGKTICETSEIEMYV